MPSTPSLAGRTFPPTAPYASAGREDREFAAAIGADRTDGGAAAPLTFPIVVAFGAMTAADDDPTSGSSCTASSTASSGSPTTRPIARR